MKHHCAFLAIALLVATAAFAQQPAPSPGDAPASKEDIQKLFEVMQIHQQMHQVMDAMMKQQSAMIRETLKQRYPQTSAERIARADQMIVETMKDMPMDAMLDDMIPIYQRHFPTRCLSTFTHRRRPEDDAGDAGPDLRGDAGLSRACKTNGRHKAKAIYLFSKADIDAMSTFYASPTGQKMMREMPALTSEAMQASSARMQKQMDAIRQKAEQIVKEDQEKPKSAPATPPSQQKN